ncbi:MAG TPA: COX15/CtaA family protein, partial [Longimicrobiaceae bacterium]
MSQTQRITRFARYAWAVLAWNVGVVLWGAFVRASGSGAGCGRHWPVCNGQVIPQSPSVKTLIEFTHRVMTGVDTLLVIGLVLLAWRLHARRSPVRKGAAASLFFLVTEALVGAGLVLFEHVAEDRSVARIWWMAVHLV